MGSGAGPKLASYWNDKDGDGRTYRHPFTGQTAPSVTTVLKMVNKDGLKQWYADMTLRHVMQNPDLFYQRSDQDFYRGARYAATNYRDERAEVGTDIHLIVEAELTNQWEVPQAWDKDVIECVDLWHAFLSEHEVIPWAVETTLWNHDWPIAGTADLIGWIDGRFGVYDLKSARGVHYENIMQLAMLKNSTEVLREVPEGTDGAVLFEKDQTINGVKHKISGWFVSEELPEIDTVGIIHIHQTETDPLTDKHVEGFQRLLLPPFGTIDVEFEDLDLVLEESMGYARSYAASKRLEARRRERGR